MTALRYTEFGEVVEVVRRVEHSISKGRRVYALKQKHSQSCAEGGSSSGPPKRGGIPMSYSDITQRSQGTGFTGDSRQAVSRSSVQPSVGSNTRNQGQYDRSGRGCHDDRSRSVQQTCCRSCGRNHQPGNIRRLCLTLSQGDSSTKRTTSWYQPSSGQSQGQKRVQTVGFTSTSRS